MKLFVYEHCPYCVKARMIFGLKNLPIEVNALLTDDEITPHSLVGKKVVPILQKADGSCMPESMDIVHYIDNSDRKPLLNGPTNPAITAWLRQVAEYSAKLLLPRFARAPLGEFATTQAREHFTVNKQAQIGDFQDHLQHSDGLVKKISQDLRALDKLIKQPNACNGELSLDDIHLFPLLRSLSIVKGVNYPPRVQAYRDNMAKQTQINLLTSMAN